MKTKKYTDDIEIKENLFSISYIGSDEIGKDNPEETNVELQCLYKNQEKWKVSFGNIKVPNGPWHKHNIIYKYKNRLLIALENYLCEVSTNTGELLVKFNFGNTTIREIQSDKRNIYIRYDDYGFNFETYNSNIVSLNEKYQLNWYAELPEEKDGYANPIKNNYFTIQTGSWKSWYCTISKRNGKIISKEYTK